VTQHIELSRISFFFSVVFLTPTLLVLFFFSFTPHLCPSECPFHVKQYKRGVTETVFLHILLSKTHFQLSVWKIYITYMYHTNTYIEWSIYRITNDLKKDFKCMLFF